MSLEGQETHDERASFQRRTHANTPSVWGYRRRSICNNERAEGGSHANLPTKAKAKVGPPCSGPRCAGGGSAYAHGRARSPHPAAQKGCPRTRNCEDGASRANGGAKNDAWRNARVRMLSMGCLRDPYALG